MRRALYAVTGFVLVLGFVHLGLAALAWRHWSAETLWFAGSGLAIVIGGLLNVAMLRVQIVDRAQKAVWLMANFVLCGFFGLAWLSMQELQVVAGGMAFGLLSVGAATASGHGADQN